MLHGSHSTDSWVKTQPSEGVSFSMKPHWEVPDGLDPFLNPEGKWS